MHKDNISRRSFVSGMAKSAFGAMIVPRHVLGGPGYVAPSDRFNVAMIGAGGMGASNAENLVAGGVVNITALADVDYGVVTRSVESRMRTRDGSPRQAGVQLQEAYAKAKRFADFREMLEKERRNIDGVVVATPDHFHAVAAKQAMELGKHVYVQKPLTYSVREARVLRDTARRTGVVTQMGNQGHSNDDARRVNEWVQAGVIGPVREVHAWTNRPIWPQGLPRPVPPPDGATPTPTAAAGQWAQRNLNELLASAMGGSYTPPAGFDWDLYLGPAQYIPYHPIYHPFNWRGWVDFGVGALGDMGAHLIDHPFWALGLGLPVTIEATSTPWGMGKDNLPATYPLATTVHYQFAARGNQPPVKLTWYDGGLMPPRPDVLPEEVTLDRTGGVLYIGDKGVLMHETYGSNPQLFPLALREQADAVPQTYERIQVSHEMNWVQAAMGQGKPSSPFEYAAPLTETMLLGIVALRTGQGREIHYDADDMRVTNIPEANEFLHRPYRAGWTL